MSQWKWQSTKLEGMRVIESFYAVDERGYFWKYFQEEALKQIGWQGTVSETFVSFSHQHVLRGMHIQQPYPQEKLVNVLWGEIWDVGLDLRPNSVTYGQWDGVCLSRENRRGLYLPAGIAHGFVVRSETALVSYVCAGEYLPEGDGGIRWDDPQIRIDWGLRQNEVPIVSKRDRELPTLAEWERWGWQWTR